MNLEFAATHCHSHTKKNFAKIYCRRSFKFKNFTLILQYLNILYHDSP